MTSRVSQQSWTAVHWLSVASSGAVLRCKEPLCVIHRLPLCCAQPVSVGERLGTVIGSRVLGYWLEVPQVFLVPG